MKQTEIDLSALIVELLVLAILSIYMELANCKVLPAGARAIAIKIIKAGNIK